MDPCPRCSLTVPVTLAPASPVRPRAGLTNRAPAHWTVIPMLAEFSTTTLAPVPPESVFAFITNLANWTSFTGWGPLPGIAEASLPPGETMREGARVAVVNTDGSRHHEVVTRFEPGRAYAVRMELTPPAAYLMEGIEELVLLRAEGAGTRIDRTFSVRARSIFTFPMVHFITHVMLRRAVLAHDARCAALMRA